jgi:hypothetical protein
MFITNILQKKLSTYLPPRSACAELMTNQRENIIMLLDILINIQENTFYQDRKYNNVT